MLSMLVSNTHPYRDYGYGEFQDSPFAPSHPILFDPSTAPSKFQNNIRPQDHSQQPTQLVGNRAFPRNSHLYPASNTLLPLGLTDELICAYYPNHLVDGHILLGMYSRGLRNGYIYDHMPADTKRENRKADMNMLHTFAYSANDKKPLGLRQGAGKGPQKRNQFPRNS
jgi:hypothetical protein